MAKITVEQVKKINSKCDNGFRLDVQYFLIHSEKTLYKDIDINNNLKIEVKINYCPEYENSLGYNRETGKLIPTLNFRKWVRESDESLWTSTDWGKRKIISDEISSAPIIFMPMTIVIAVKAAMSILYKDTFVPVALAKLSSKVTANISW